MSSVEIVLWKDIPGYEGLYKACVNGDIWSYKNKKLLSKTPITNGYIGASLWGYGFRKQTTVHRLIAITFLGDNPSLEVNHINGIKTDNRVDNLEWVTKAQNARHSVDVLKNLVKPVIGINLLTGEVVNFESLISTLEQGFSPSKVSACCLKKSRAHQGWRFIFAN